MIWKCWAVEPRIGYNTVPSKYTLNDITSTKKYLSITSSVKPIPRSNLIDSLLKDFLYI